MQVLAHVDRDATKELWHRAGAPLQRPAPGQLRPRRRRRPQLPQGQAQRQQRGERDCWK